MAQQGSGYQARYKRILLKLSGEALMGSEEFGIDPKCWIAWRWKSANWSASAYRSAW
jgi:uridylate kinase